jgi:hypothetical protein
MFFFFLFTSLSRWCVIFLGIRELRRVSSANVVLLTTRANVVGPYQGFELAHVLGHGFHLLFLPLDLLVNEIDSGSYSHGKRCCHQRVAVHGLLNKIDLSSR